jgi:hypothetical protein
MSGAGADDTTQALTRWFWIRAVCALGVLGLLVVELSGHRGPAVVVPQALLIVCIVITSALGLRRR